MDVTGLHLQRQLLSEVGGCMNFRGMLFNSVESASIHIHPTSKIYFPYSNNPQSLNPFQHQLCLIANVNINSQGPTSHHLNHLNQVWVYVSYMAYWNMDSGFGPFWSRNPLLPQTCVLLTYVSGSILNASFLSALSTYFHAS